MGLEDIDEFDSPILVGRVIKKQASVLPEQVGEGNNKTIIAAAATTITTTTETTSKNFSSISNNKNDNIVNSAKVDLSDLFSDLAVSSITPAVSSNNGGDNKQVVNTQNEKKEEEEWSWAAPSQPQLQQSQKQQKVSQTSNDLLDNFFSSPPSNISSNNTVVSPKYDKSNDLLDFSKPTERAKYSDAKSFLEAFENQGKGKRFETRDGPSLADLSKGSSDNIVKARLLKIMNYYDILGITRDASEDQIRQKYKRKALELHPDRVGRDQTPEEAELFKMMTKAYEVLSDNEERAKYDKELLRASGEVNHEEYCLFHLRPQ